MNLTPEHQALSDYEAIISEGLATFERVGVALIQIRNQQLYRATHDTFQNYCAERWNMTASRAYQLIDAATIVENISQISTIVEKPTHETQVRPLAKAAPEIQREAWTEATKVTPNPTAKEVQAALEKVTGTKPKEKAKKPAYKEPCSHHTVLTNDKTEWKCEGCGHYIPSPDENGTETLEERLVVAKNAPAEVKPIFDPELEILLRQTMAKVAKYAQKHADNFDVATELNQIVASASLILEILASQLKVKVA